MIGDLEIARLRATIELESSRFNREVDQVKAKQRELEREFDRAGQAARRQSGDLGDLEKTLGRLNLGAHAVHTAMIAEAAIVAATTATIVVATREAIAFERAMTGVAKTVDGTDAQIKALGSDIRALSRDTGMSAEGLARIAETAGAADVALPDLPRVTRTAAQLSIGAPSLGNTEEATLGLVRLMKVAGESVDEVDRVASAIVHLGNNGASTEKEILDMSLRIAGAGRIAGLSTPEILALSNAIASSGVEAEMGGSAISKSLIDMTNAVKSNTREGREQLEAFARTAGVTAEEFRQKFAESPAQALRMVLEGINRVDQAGGNAFQTLAALGVEEVRQRDVMLRLAQGYNDFNQSLANANEGWLTQNKHVIEAQKQIDGAAGQLARAQRNAEDLARVFGGPMGEAAGQLAKAFADAASAESEHAETIAQELRPEIQKLVSEITPLLTAFAHGIPESVALGAAAFATVIQDLKAMKKAVDDINNALPHLPPSPSGRTWGDEGHIDDVTFGTTRRIRENRARMHFQGQADQLSGFLPGVDPNLTASLMRSLAPGSSESNTETLQRFIRLVDHNLPTDKVHEFVSELERISGAQFPDIGPVLESMGYAAQVAADGVQELGDAADEAESPVADLDAATRAAIESAHNAAGRIRAVAEEATQLALAGNEGAAVVKALDDALADMAAADYGKKLDTIGLAVARLTQSFKGLPQASAWTAEINDLIEQSIAGVEGSRERLLARLQQIEQTEVPGAKDEQRKAEQAAAKAQREQEAAVRAAEREIERARERHRDLVHGLTTSLDDAAPEIQAAYGRLGGEIRSGLRQAMDPEAGQGVGQSLGRNVSELIKNAVTAGVPDAEEAGREIKAAVLRAVSTKDAGDEAAALALVQNLTDSIKAQSALTPANFARSLLAAQSRADLGDFGSITDAIKRSVESGTPEALDAVGSAVEAVRRRLMGNEGLTPEQAEAYWDRIMHAVTMAIEEGTPEARQALQDLFASVNLDQLAMVAANQMEERIGKAAEQLATQIRDAQRTAEERMQQAIEQLDESRLLRGMRENVAAVQAEELANAKRANDLALQDYRDYMDDRERIHSRGLEDEARRESRAREDVRLAEEARRAGQRSQSGTRGFSEKEIADARRSGVGVGPQNDPGYELFRRRQALAESRREEDAELVRKRKLEDDELERRRGLRAVDQTEIETITKVLANFQKGQALEVRGFEDRLANERLTWMLSPEGPIEKEKLARIAAARAVDAEQRRLAGEQINDRLRRQGLPPIEVPTGSIVPSNAATFGLVPSGMAGAALTGAGAGSQSAEPSVIIQNDFTGANFVGPGGMQDVVDIIEQGLARRNHTQFAIGGLGR